jgi:hypothetical protein
MRTAMKEKKVPGVEAPVMTLYPLYQTISARKLVHQITGVTIDFFCNSIQFFFKLGPIMLSCFRIEFP